MGFIVQLVIVVIGGGWLISLIDAETKCPWIFKSWRSAPACVGGGEIWMMPMFTGAIGVPALLMSIVIIGAQFGKRSS
jgi:hypothetical protein